MSRLRPGCWNGAATTCLSPTPRNTEEFPSLRNISARFIFSGVVSPLEPAPPEYVTLSMRPASDREFVAVAQWNMLWEAAQFRRRFFDLDDLPEQMAKIAEIGHLRAADTGAVLRVCAAVSFVPKRVLDLLGLPLLRGAQWPFMADSADIDNFLPPDFEARLARAWAWTLWRWWGRRRKSGELDSDVVPTTGHRRMGAH